MAELLKQFETEIESIALFPSDGGRFEIKANGNLIYSKLQTGRHCQPSEAVELVRKNLLEGK